LDHAEQDESGFFDLLNPNWEGPRPYFIAEQFKSELKKRLLATLDEFKTSAIRGWPVTPKSEDDAIYEAYRVVWRLWRTLLDARSPDLWLGGDPSEIASSLLQPRPVIPTDAFNEVEPTRPTAIPNDPTYVLTDTEATIIEALGTNHLTGERLAVKAGYPYNSNFKGNLSSLVKRGMLDNKTGYFVTSRGTVALESFRGKQGDHG